MTAPHCYKHKFQRRPLRKASNLYSLQHTRTMSVQCKGACSIISSMSPQRTYRRNYRSCYKSYFVVQESVILGRDTYIIDKLLSGHSMRHNERHFSIVRSSSSIKSSGTATSKNRQPEGIQRCQSLYSQPTIGIHSKNGKQWAPVSSICTLL